MYNKETILSELKEIAPILITLNKNVYTIPDGYFNYFATEISKLINAGILLDEARGTPPVFQVPDNYFESLSDSIIAKIKLKNNECFDELEEMAPALNSISKKNIYTVPDGYFNNLEVNISPEKIPAAKIVFFSKTRRLVSYAAAAMIAGILVTGAFFYPGSNVSFDVSKEVNKLSDTELNKYLETIHSASFLDDTMIINQETPNIQEHLKLISDEELQQYLDENENEELPPVQNKEGI